MFYVIIVYPAWNLNRRITIFANPINRNNVEIGHKNGNVGSNWINFIFQDFTENAPNLLNNSLFTNSNRTTTMAVVLVKVEG